MSTTSAPTTLIRSHRRPSAMGAAFTALVGAVRAVAKGPRAKPVPAYLVHEAGPIAAEDWEPAVPLR